MKNKKAKVAVWLANYNVAKYILQQLDTIINQNIYSDKIFISIDKSHDKTLSIMKSNINIEIISKKHEIWWSFTNFIYFMQIKKYDYVALNAQDNICVKK